MKFNSLIFLSSFISYIYAFESSCSESGEQCLHITQCPLELQKVVAKFKSQPKAIKDTIFKKRCGKEGSRHLCCQPPECYTWDGRPGVCIKVDPVTFRKTSQMSTRQIKISRCYNKTGPYICHSDLPVTQSEKCEASAFPSDPSHECCGKDHVVQDKIIGGDGTTIDQFPWLAVLKYDNNIKNCSGVLISNRYILTAAHCVDYSSAKPYAVVLGEYDKRTENDCDFNHDCHDAADEVTIQVEEIIVHENYSTAYKFERNDIALIRLMQPVTYSDFILPICLPSGTKDVTEKPPPKFELWSAGWGNVNATYRSPSDIKMKVKLPFVTSVDCASKISRSVWDDQMCAGGEKDKDTCSGDSGSGLMYLNRNNTFEVLGITSHGVTYCGAPGIPAMYTKVFYYIQWIHTHIRP